MKRAGFLMKSLGISQKAFYLIRNVNDLMDAHVDLDVIVFFENYDRIPILPHFAMMQEREVWGYDAPVIACDLASAQKLLSSPNPHPKYFYVWDLEWLYMDTLSYSQLKDIYRHENLTLIARSESHAGILEQCWKKPKYIIPDFNHKQFLPLLLSRENL